MIKRRNLYFGTLLSFCCITTTGCFNNDQNYEFQYLITDSKAMETSDIVEPEKGQTHLYVRGWDSVRPEIIDGKRGMQGLAEYTYEKFSEALQPDTKMLSVEMMASTITTTCTEMLRTELDNFFKNNGENDISYVALTSHGDATGGLALFDDGVSGTDLYSQVIHFNTIVDWLNEYKGRFFVFLSACFSGRWLDPAYSISTDFLRKVGAAGDKFTIITEASTSNLYSPYRYGPFDTTATMAAGLVADENNRMPADLNQDGNVTVEELFLYGRVNWATKGTDCHLYAPNRSDEIFLKNRCVELFSTNNGYFVEEGNERKVIKVPSNKIINSLGMPSVKEGYKFVGWSYDKEGKNKVKFPLTLTSNVRMYANYKRGKSQAKGYISANKHDTIRIPYRDGTYGDYLILDFKTNDDKDGMFVISKNIAGMTSFPKEGQTSGYYFENTAAQAWCHEFTNRLFSNKLNEFISPSNAVLGTNNPQLKLDNEKLFFLNRSEALELLPESMRKLDEDYFLRGDNSNNNHYINTNGSIMTDLAKTKTNVKGTRPAMNLSISKEDLVYEPETSTFYIKGLGRYIRKAKQRYDGTYTVKINGNVTYTASGNRKLACDNMNSLATTFWETNTGFTYAYSETDRHLYKPGAYRGIVYNEVIRDFYDFENIENCVDGTSVEGTDSSGAISASYSLTFDKKFTANDMTCPGSLYNEKNFAADAVTNGTGSLKDYKDVGKVKHLDYVSVVNNPTLPEAINNDTKAFLDALKESFEGNGKSIHQEVFSYILPGDMLVSRYTDQVLEADISHTRLITGVEITRDNSGNVDPALSKVIFADAASPLVGRYIYGGQRTSFLTSDVYSKTATNTMTFNDLLTSGYIPVTLNNWETGF